MDPTKPTSMTYSLNPILPAAPYTEVYVPNTTPTKPVLETLSETAIKVACFAVSIFTDLILVLFAAGLLLFAVSYKSNFDPSPDQIKKDHTPILMIHGNGFNEIQWVMGRQFLSDPQYGSVFTLNLDGLITNETTQGIDDYAQKVSAKIQEIQNLTGRKDITLIGHSMGGLVASYYAENLSGENAQVDKIITISSPWHGSPLLKFFTEITEKYLPSLFKEPKRFQQMNNENNFLVKLRAQAVQSESERKRVYYSIYSEADMMVSDETGRLHDRAKHTSTRSHSYSLLGHFTPMVYPPLWKQIQDWVK